MVELDTLRDFRISKQKLFLPIGEEDASKGNVIILNTKSSYSIRSIIKNPMIEDRNHYKNVYRNRDVELRIKGNKIIEHGTTTRNFYYKYCKENFKINGVISLFSLEGKNFYYDIYRENELFFQNTDKLSKLVKATEYFKNIQASILSNPFLNKYDRKIVIINLEDWSFDLNGMDKVKNPIDVIYQMMRHEFDEFHAINDVKFLFITSKAMFIMDPFTCDKTSHLNFFKAIKQLDGTITSDKDDNSISLSNEIEYKDDDELDTELENEDDLEFDERAEEIIKQEEKLNNSEELETDDPEKVEALANKILEPVNIKKDSISKRDEELRKKQKTLKIEGTTLDELRSRKASDIPIPINDVSKDINTLNKDITKVQFHNFADTYNKELYMRDIVSIADSMKDKSVPVFVREMKKEDTSDSLNQKETYTFYLEDTNRGRHTLKFDVPKFIEGRYMYLNGHKKEFNNQRFLKPLVKTGPDTVQVCTNYNKIFMTRYGEKVESLFEKFKALVLSDKKHFEYKRGDCSRLNGEYKTTIEYDTLAKQFAEIIVKPEKGYRLHLIFSQPKIKEFCMGKGNMVKEYETISKSDDLLVCGYYENGSGKYSIYAIDTSRSDEFEEERIPVPTKESVGEAFTLEPEEISIDSIQESIKTIEWNLMMTENKINSVIEEEQFDPFQIYTEPVEEGVLSSIWKGIKDLLKSVLKIILKIWNGIVSLVKAIFHKIKSFFSSSSNSAKSNFVPQEVSFISLESARVENVTISSPKELQEMVVSHIESISREIRDRSAIQIDATKEMNKLLEEKEEAVQERVIIGGKFDLDPNIDEVKFSMPARDIVSSRQIIRPRTFDVKSFKLLEQANDIVKEYNQWIEADLERIFKAPPIDLRGDSVQDHDTSGIEGLVQACYYGAMAQGLPKEEVIKFCKAEVYKVPDNPEAIRHLVRLRLNYNKKISNLLENMLKINYAILGVTNETANEIILRLREGDPEDIGKVNDIITKNRSKFTKELIQNGMHQNYLDFGSIGGGICYYTNEDLRNLKDVLLKTPERFFNLALRFDYVIMGHGGVGIDYSKQEILEKENPEYLELRRRKSKIEYKIDPTGKPIKRDPNTFSQDEFKELSSIKLKMAEFEKGKISYWMIQPIATKHFPVTNDVNQLMRNVIEEGHMEGKKYIKIFLLCCNGGHFDLADDVRNAKGVTIICAANKMLAD